MKTETAILGGGLAGLALADGLHQAGVGFQLFESRARLGDRIAALNTMTGAVDLGPSWFWPEQPRIARLIADLGLRAFPQHADGDICYEDERGAVHRCMGFASMERSFRLEGGMVTGPRLSCSGRQAHAIVMPNVGGGQVRRFRETYLAWWEAQARARASAKEVANARKSATFAAI